jgi:hypothetical protein
MRVQLMLFSLVLLLVVGVSTSSSAQNFTTPAPDGSTSATFAADCVSSRFFDFSLRVPERMSFDDQPKAPESGKDDTRLNFVIFTAHRPHGANKDVVVAAAEDRRSAPDSGAASWMRALHDLNTTRSDVPTQGEVESVSAGDQKFSRLRFQQKREDGVITYQSAYAVGVRGYVIYFVFGSVDQNTLHSMEESMNSFTTKVGACRNLPSH